MRCIRRILRWILFITAGVIGVLTILVLAGPTIRNWQLERAIARFERRPSQGRADSLVELLQLHAGTDEQGGRALALLFRPNIVTRKAYAAGRSVAIRLQIPFKLPRKFSWGTETITINGLFAARYPGGYDLSEGACLNVPGAYTQPGTYPMELRIRRSVGIERTSRAATVLSYLHDGLPWLIPGAVTWQPSRLYECDFTVSAQPIVVTDHEAEEVELIASPELDRAMRGAFSARYVATQTKLSTPTSERCVRGSTQISYENIPLAVAFSITLRLSDGREIPMHDINPWRFSARAGTSGNVLVVPSPSAAEAPGRYKATLVLVPDPDFAYRDPTIKAIWNGTLEFPVSFTIDANEPGR